MKRIVLLFAILPVVAIVGVMAWSLWDSQIHKRDSARTVLSMVNMQKSKHCQVLNYHTMSKNWPERLDQIRGVFDVSEFDEAMKNPYTGDDPGYEYVKPGIPKEGHTLNADAILLYQLRGVLKGDFVSCRLQRKTVGSGQLANLGLKQ